MQAAHAYTCRHLQWVPVVIKAGTLQHAHVYLQIGAESLHAQPVAEPESFLGELSMAEIPIHH